MTPHASDPVPARCGWATGDALYLHYHDHEWGVPVFDDARLFECLTLEGAQAGLSWRTILNKRKGYRRAFKEFDPVKVARMRDSSVERLLGDAGIVRHRGKIESTLKNARRVVEVQKEVGSFAEFVWSFVDGRPRQNQFSDLVDLPSETDESRALSKALKKRGFGFVGPTTCYAFMQATGCVNDHVVSCFCHDRVAGLSAEGPATTET